MLRSELVFLPTGRSVGDEYTAASPTWPKGAEM
jgi:hypothetical protein